MTSPSDISAIELAHDSGDTIEEFTVNFQVQYFTVGETDSSANGSFDETVEENPQLLSKSDISKHKY